MATVTNVNLEIDLHAKRASYLQLADRVKAAIDAGYANEIVSLDGIAERIAAMGRRNGV